MSVPSQVLENGQYVTRMLDPYQILARNRVRQEDNNESIVEPAAPVKRALLTQTLIHTPDIKWIFPARLRDSDSADLIFVSDDCVQVKEAFQDFPMVSLCTKDDFDSPIRNAALIGKAKPDPPAKQESTSEIKLEVSDSIRGRTDANGLTLTQEPSNIYNDPPQILILILEDASLIFLHPRSPHTGQLGFVCTQKVLPVACNRLHQIGEFVAVDPESRALAIGAQEKYFYLYSLRSRISLDPGCRDDLPVVPVASERRFLVDGVILKMEFLYPSRGDEDHVLLVLVVSKKGRSRLVWYEWDTRVQLVDAEIKAKWFALPEESSLPLLMIPLKVHNAFILVGQSITSVFKNILTGTPDQYTIHLVEPVKAEYACVARYSPIWVQWARAIRYRNHGLSHQPYTQADDNVYLCREDGLVLFLDIRNSLSHMVESHHSAGRLGAKIGTAFAVIDLGEYAVDLLVAQGDSNSGGVWQFYPRENAAQTQALTNWSPLTDLIYIPKLSDPDGRGGPLTDDSHGIVMACASPSTRGALTQLHFGIEASSLDVLNIESLGATPIMDAWTAFAGEDMCYLVISHPMSTLLVQIEEESVPEPMDSHVGFVLNDTTLLVHTFPDGGICQITRHTIVLFNTLDTDSVHILWRKDFEVEEEIVSACIDSANERHCLCAAVSRQGDFTLVFYAIEQGEVIVQSHIPIESYPTALAMHLIESKVYLVVANEAGSLQARVLCQRNSHSQNDIVAIWNFELAEQVCDSMALFVEDSGSASTCCRVVCGLRNGCVHILKLDYDARKFHAIEQIFVGNTAVRLKVAVLSPHSVYLLCDNELYSLEVPQQSAPWSQAKVRHIIRNDALGKVVTTDVLAFAPPNTVSQSLNMRANFVVIVTAVDIHFSLPATAGFELLPKRRRPASSHQEPLRMRLYRQFSSNDLTISRRSCISTGTPIRTIFSFHLKQEIVLLLDMKVPRSRAGYGSKHTPQKRKMEASIGFVDIGKASSSKDSEVEEAQPPTFPIPTKHGERPLNIVEWFPKINEMEYHLLLINTMVKDRHKPASGRILFYAVTAVAGRVVKLELKKALEMKSPVYSMACIWDRSSLVYGHGNDLTVLTLKPGSAGLKFDLQFHLTMRSPARHLTACEPYIHVSTANESCQIYSFHDSELWYEYGDTVARNGLYHLSIPEISMVVATDMHGSITGFWQPPINQVNNALPTVFEAKLDRAITRMFRVNAPPKQRDYMISGGPLLLAEGSLSNEEDDSQSTIYDARPGALIGSSTDGTFVQMNIIDKGGRLLELVQNLCECSPSLCPFSSRRARSHLERSRDKHSSMHINGDILSRLFPAGGAGTLLGLLERPLSQEDGRLVQSDESAQQNWERFSTLSSEVLGQGFVDKADNREVIVKEVIRWIAYIMRSAL